MQGNTVRDGADADRCLVVSPRSGAQPPPPRPEDRIPERCPDCGIPLATVGDVAICARCGFRSDHPLAGRLREVDLELANLSAERSGLIDRIRSERQPLPPPPPSAPAPPTTPRRSLSVQVILVGLGAFLVVVAGAIFAVVTWEELGAAGQAAVLVAATATAAGVTVAAARARLTATAEALAVVAAGFAFLDVHAVRTAAAPDAPWQTAWAVGIVLVAGALVAFGRAVGLRGPAIIAVTAVQLPVVFLASLADPSGLAAATALVVTAALDLLAAKVVAAKSFEWLPAPAPSLVRPLGAAVWVIGVVAVAPWALGSAAVGARWWAVGVLVAATAVSAVASSDARPRDHLAVGAAATTVLAGLIAVVGIGRQVVDDETALLLVANASAVALLVVSLAVLGTGGRDGLRPRDPERRVDPRLVAGTVAAATWAAFSLLPWTGQVVDAMLAPFVLLAEDGWWTRGLSATTGDLETLSSHAEDLEAPSVWFVLAAVAIATVGLVTSIRLIGRGSRIVRRAVTMLALGAGFLSAIAVIGALGDVPVASLVLVYLLATAMTAVGAVRSDLHHGTWLALAALPIAASAVAWAGNVELLTVVALGALTVLGAVVVASAIGRQRRSLAVAATPATGVTLGFTAITTALALGAAEPAAWVLAIAACSVASGAAWLGDRWAPWWSPAVDLTSAAVGGAALVGSAVSGGLDPLSIGLVMVVATAAAHATRPSRRAIAAIVAAAAALVLWWLRAWGADVRVVEVYSLPAAGVAGAIGYRQLRRRPALGSWRTIGPALLIAAVPSVVVSISGSGVLRPLLVLTAAAALTVAGARRRLRAPVAVGAVTAVIIAVDQLFPAVAWLPRWTVIGAVGILLLYTGATFERQRRRVAGLYERYHQLQ